MVIKSIIGNYKKDSNDLIERSTLIERLRRARALNIKPSDIGITQYTWKTFSIKESSGCIKRR